MLRGIILATMSGGKILTRIYFPGEIGAPGECVLAPGPSHHVARVLRLKEGDPLTLFNGDGADYSAVVTGVRKGAVALRVEARRAASRESPLEIVLGQALSGGERMDYTIQKAVELGVAAIQPLAAIRSVVRLTGERADRRVAHWRAVTIAACEQCGRNRLPQIASAAPLAQWLEQCAARNDGARRLLLTPRGGARLRELERPAYSVMILAGPEGGLTREEEAAARRSGFVPVSLGPRVLRTETAAVAALAAMQALWGDF